MINTITIVGGGTSGWLSAAYLKSKNPHANITIVDKEDGTSVGVGEATILSFIPFMEECGFPIETWFNEIGATYKSGILFTGWTEKSDVWHPFYNNPNLDNYSLHDVWLNSSKKDFTLNALPFLEESIKNKIVEEYLGAYAVHMDCSLLVKFLRDNINVTFVKSEVGDYKNNKLYLTNGTVIESDLYIDCSGFKSILKTPNKVNLQNRLFCDTAVAGHVDYLNKDVERRPFVISDMVDHGWVWHIPVQTRIGTGMVFNRNMLNIDDAKKYFVEYWSGRVGELKIIDWTPYYSTNIWEDRVVSIGLSAGFIEPLESTGVALITEGLLRLQNKISMGFWSQNDIDSYNLEMTMTFEDAVDFVSMHYSKPWKNTKFWNWVRDTYVESSRISSIRNILKTRLLYSHNYRNTGIFTGANWTTWMIQLGYDVNSSINMNTRDADNIIDNFAV